MKSLVRNPENKGQEKRTDRSTQSLDTREGKKHRHKGKAEKGNPALPIHQKILFVCSGNGELVAPFITDQKEALEARGAQVDLFTIKGKGILGYLKNLRALRTTIKRGSYEVVHAHYGMSGLLACLQFRVPVVITLHGSDVNDPKVRIFSKIAARLASEVIVVSQKMKDLLGYRKATTVIPCGVDIGMFVPMDKAYARRKLEIAGKMKFEEGKKYVMFSSSFNNEVKNPGLAMEAVKQLGEGYELIELKGFSRREVACLFNAADAALMTSKSEGSPQFVKEAMACNCPVVSTPVGDVEAIFNGTNGCFLVQPEAEAVADKMKIAAAFGKTSGRRQMPQVYRKKEVTNKLIRNYFKSEVDKVLVHLSMRKVSAVHS